jgi:hypothetical protein
MQQLDLLLSGCVLNGTWHSVQNTRSAGIVGKHQAHELAAISEEVDRAGLYFLCDVLSLESSCADRRCAMLLRYEVHDLIHAMRMAASFSP